jgi:hypothetical protein
LNPNPLTPAKRLPFDFCHLNFEILNDRSNGKGQISKMANPKSLTPGPSPPRGRGESRFDFSRPRAQGGERRVDPSSTPQVLLYELRADLNSYLAALGPGAPVHSLREIIEFNERNREKEMPYFGQDQFIKAEAKGSLREKEYLDRLEKNHRLTRKEGIDAVMEKFQLDALVAPTGGPAWLTDLVDGDHDSGGSSTPAAVAGYPNINVPVGFVFGLPVGISFFGKAYSEPTLLKLTYAFEQATRHRGVPQFLPTADLTP